MRPRSWLTCSLYAHNANFRKVTEKQIQQVTWLANGCVGSYCNSEIAYDIALYNYTSTTFPSVHHYTGGKVSVEECLSHGGQNHRDSEYLHTLLILNTHFSGCTSPHPAPLPPHLLITVVVHCTYLYLFYYYYYYYYCFLFAPHHTFPPPPPRLLTARPSIPLVTVEIKVKHLAEGGCALPWNWTCNL